MLKKTTEDDPIPGVLRRLLEDQGRPLVLKDLASGKEIKISADAAVAPDGMLPALMAAGEAVWKAATGHGFGLKVEPAAGTLLGFRVASYDQSDRLAALMATTQAVKEICRQDFIPLNDLNVVWRNHSRILEEHRPTPSKGPSP